jgi:TRAP transporter 4TM/12TM fusion protein
MNIFQRIPSLAGGDPMTRRIFGILAALLSLFILVEVNRSLLSPQSRLAIFAMLGLILVFLKHPLHRGASSDEQSGGPDTSIGKHLFKIVDFVLIIAVVLCFGYVLIQTEPIFQRFWTDGMSLGDRAGVEVKMDYVIGLLGVLLVLEATRRSIGSTLPLLAIAFLVYAAFGQSMPDWLFPHRGHSWERIVSQTFLQSQGVFGVALKVMFTYVFLFVLFGTLLEKTGATGYIIRFARRLFRASAGGPAKVAVISSGMMGSLSGSAVANTATTGTFTIPMMKGSGFKPHVAGGIEAAASSGGALVPPIMGAGAYMMLEIVEPAVTYLQIIKAAIIPAILYYTALLLIVHFHAGRLTAGTASEELSEDQTLPKFQGFLFFAAFVSLILFLLMGRTPFRAVSLSLVLILVLGFFNKSTRVGVRGIFEAMEKAAHGGISLIAAASCVGLILGVVTLTGIGTKLPGMLLPLAKSNLILALLLLMVSTIILGMGLPSSVCYLLMATLVGPVLADLGIVPLAAHLFIFYFGMMSMVTPPVALAAYTAGAIAEAGIMQTGFAAFRFAWVGFALPYAFVLRPELLLLTPDGGSAGLLAVGTNVLVTVFGIVALAASVSGYALRPLNIWYRLILLTAAMVLFLAQSVWLLVAAAITVLGLGIFNWHNKNLTQRRREAETQGR